MKTLNHEQQAEHSTHRFSLRTWLLVASAMLIFVSMPASAEPASRLFDDPAITSTVKSDLRFEMAVFPNNLDISASQGIVTLSGSVNDMLAKRRAVRIAESVRGVLGVIDRITVSPEVRPDEDIRKDILTALLDDPATESYQVSVSVKDGVVTLTGNIGSMAESRLAQRVAESVSGVKDLHNNLIINYGGTRTDDEITADIQSVLHWDIWVTGYPIQVDVKGGNVTLTGKVGSVIEKLRVDSDAWVNGVFSVDDNGLKVEPGARDQLRRRGEFAIRPPDEITKALLSSFRRDPRVSHYAGMINVSIEDGVTILDGAVGNLKAKSTAGQDARDIVGVSSVDNELSVRPNESLPSDRDAQKDLEAVLHWDLLLERVPIEAAVVNHVAYLNGSVYSMEQKADAEDDASRTRGVLEVRNYLKIEPEPGFFFYDQPYYDFEVFGPPPLKSDAQIKKGIERAFFWSPFVHRNDITVKVDNGVAELSGTVGTWIGYEEAYQDARKGGARVVILENLKVKKGGWF